MRRALLKYSTLLPVLVLAGCHEQPLAPELGDFRPSFAHLPGEVGFPGIVLTGPGAGAAPQVASFSGSDGSSVGSFLAYDAGFTGGVRVASGDVDGDGVPDVVTGAGPGGAPHVKVFDGATGEELSSFLAFDPLFAGGVYVASGDVDGDGYDDVVAGAGAGGGPHVKVFSGASGAELMSFFGAAPLFAGGIPVAAGDVNGDGRADIITGTGPGAATVRVFNGASGALMISFLPYAGASTGVFVAAGDVTGDGFADIVTGAGPGGAAHVKVFDGSALREISSFAAYDPTFTGGVHVGAADVDGDGHADVLTGPAGSAGPHVKVFSGASGAELLSFFAYAPGFTGGVWVSGAIGTSAPTPPSLREDAERAVSEGRLEGAGSGASGRGRLKAWMNMLASAEALFASGEVDEACRVLRDAYLRADGLTPPPDFVQGDARSELAAAIEAVASYQGCEAL